MRTWGKRKCGEEEDEEPPRSKRQKRELRPRFVIRYWESAQLRYTRGAARRAAERAAPDQPCLTPCYASPVEKDAQCRQIRRHSPRRSPRWPAIIGGVGSQKSWQFSATLDPVRWRNRSQPRIAAEGIPPEKLEQRAREAVLHSRINWAYRRWQEYMDSADTWGATHAGILGQRPAAYFSAEFGMHESLPIYSGGLGVLSGDHLKSASDLGIPLVGVGLFYDEGYFSQYIDEERLAAGIVHRTSTPTTLPVHPALDTERQAGRDLRRHAQRQNLRPGLAGRRRPRPAVPARHRHRPKTRTKTAT